MQGAGRNDNCPCGSGKKYKKCCLANIQPASDDLARQRVHNMHLKLIRKLMEFTAKTYGQVGYNEAWDEFNLWTNEDSFDPDSFLHPMFGPWMFYHWISEELTPAEAFLEKYRNRLDELEIEDLEESLRRPFSFYEVLECKPGSWVKVQDLFTEEYFTVLEKLGSQAMKSGDVLFGKVTTVRDISFFDGLAPFAFQPQQKIKVIEERKRYRRKNGRITAARLRDDDLQMLEIFWDMYEAVTDTRPPIMTNTEGHLMVPHRMTFSVASLEETFEALHDLDFNDSKKELLDRSERSASGEIKCIEFPWLMKGNKMNQHWENTVLGHIRLEGQCMIVDVNSKERKKKFLAILKKRMPKGWVLTKTEIETIESALTRQQRPRGGEGEGPEIEELNEHPEVKEYVAKMNEGHWKNWPMTPLPALKGKTPVEAIKSKDGREMVDALITQFERNAEQSPMSGQTVETFQKLRDRLGL